MDFSYKNDENVLKDLNFTIKAGSQVVLTGANGAGKSTIFKLLLKLLDVKAGKILVDGKNLYDIDEQSWLNNIGWVAQEPYVFKSSLRENITLGRACSKTQLERVTQLVNLTEFIKKQEHGYDSIVGGAINLSSGQKRRLGLARALLCNPKVLLLDEPMENLDSKNEELIKSVLEKLKGKVTVIIIAHRRQTIEAADKIIILDKGTIKEYGSAEELKKTNSYYHQLLNRLEGNLLYDK